MDFMVILITDLVKKKSSLISSSTHPLELKAPAATRFTRILNDWLESAIS